MTSLSVVRVFANVVSELLTLRRLTRFWLLVFLLSLMCQTGFVLACWQLGYHLPYAPTSGINTPKYLLGNVDPTIVLFFQWAVLLLMFDIAQRHKRNLITEVLNSSPLTNLETLVGQTLAVVGIVWALVVLNILIMQVVGSISIFGWNFSESLQFHSVLNLVLIDLPANLLLWCSFLTLLQVVVRARLLVLLICGSAMFGWYWLVIRSPHSLLSLVSPSSNDSLIVSELLPSVISFNTGCIRISYVLGAVFLLVSAALIRTRIDGLKPRNLNLVLLPTSLVLGLGAFFLGVSGFLSTTGEVERWKAIHTEYQWDDDIDVQRISGTVHIDPSKSLDLDLVISLVRNSGEINKPLVFTMNPGLKPQEIEVENSSAGYNFDNGLLEIQIGNTVEVGVPFEVKISARGVPDPKFAYLDSAINYLTDRDVPVRSVQLFGKYGSIFSPRYVALMPGSHWYPTPGPVNTTYARSMKGRDFFEVDLQVTLKPNHWTLVASAASTKLSSSANTYQVGSNAVVPKLGLFASRFEHATIEVGGIDFTMYLHKTHLDNLHPIENWEDAMLAKAESMIAEYKERELLLPHSAITFVEIPRTLRTVGGGWRMDGVDTLPGLILLKEHGFPRAKLELALNRYENRSNMFEFMVEEDSELVAPLTVLSLYFNRGIGTDAPWTSLNKHFWTHHTSPKGEYAPLLDHFVNWLFAYLPPHLNRQFSIYSTMHVSDHVKLHLDSAETGIQYAVSSDQRILSPWFEPDEVRVERTFYERVSNLARTRKHGFIQPPSMYGSQYDLESILIKSREIAMAFFASNRYDDIFSWLNDMRTKYYGQNFTHTDLIECAKLHEITIEPFLTDWITESELPALAVYEPSIRQIADDEQGNARYQVTFLLENASRVAAHVEILSPMATAGDLYYWSFRTTDSLNIGGNETLRVNFVTDHKINRFAIDPGFSINRDIFYIDLKREDIEHNLNEQPAPFLEVATEIRADPRIIVDDLDDGFRVSQEIPKPPPTLRFGPVSWLTTPRVGVELDSDLPIRPLHGRSHQLMDIWQRWNHGSEVAPFGRYRRSTAYLQTTISRDEKVPKAEFTTRLTSDGEWQLEYFYPWLPGTSWGTWGMPKDDTVSLEIVQGDLTYQVPLDLIPMPYGWYEVGTFQLTDDDKVSVAVVYQPTSGREWARVFADAIRWTPMDDS